MDFWISEKISLYRQSSELLDPTTQIKPYELWDMELQLKQMMGLISTFSDRVNVTESQKTSMEKSPSVSLTTRTTARARFQSQPSPTSGRCMSASVRRKVARRMRDLCLPKEMSSDEELDSGEDQPITQKHRPLKSVLDRTRATIVVHNITCMVT